jgi:hypothetical protein
MNVIATCDGKFWACQSSCWTAELLFMQEGYCMLTETQTEVADTVRITWTEEFQMGATSAEFDNGAQFTLTTKLYDIVYGQMFNVRPFITFQR